MDDVTGPRAGGGRFDIATDAGSEILVSAGGGLRRNPGQRWSFELGLQADRHFADWKLTDRVSGRTGTIDDYTTYGVHFGFAFRL